MRFNTPNLLALGVACFTLSVHARPFPDHDRPWEKISEDEDCKDGPWSCKGIHATPGINPNAPPPTAPTSEKPHQGWRPGDDLTDSPCKDASFTCDIVMTPKPIPGGGVPKQPEGPRPNQETCKDGEPGCHAPPGMSCKAGIRGCPKKPGEKGPFDNLPPRPTLVGDGNTTLPTPGIPNQDTCKDGELGCRAPPGMSCKDGIMGCPPHPTLVGDGNAPLPTAIPSQAPTPVTTAPDMAFTYTPPPPVGNCGQGLGEACVPDPPKLPETTIRVPVATLTPTQTAKETFVATPIPISGNGEAPGEQVPNPGYR
ncbi:hypothetical protein K504DRAFT_106316 [Pleomassaria siparia CBS 279.74]|uniref:Uncharacterized protein n=1 Tax=Pleomassaria siparia CBS 279.74 TaxID=1314801 RepID=A0A6G1JXR6_9PLEO|nr:hypothetical protein K504DRAFT_106316 [Pleomassaria siparia CBS 279.74]